MWPSPRALLVVSATAFLGWTAAAQKPPVLFDGKNLKGWRGDPTLWRVENGEIVGTVKDRLAHNAFLVSDRVLADFRLIVDVKLKTADNNSGIQFRSRKYDDKGKPSVAGYQADIGGKDGVYWGQLYDEHGRGWLSTKSCGAYVKNGDWNVYEILAIGSKIQTAVNGHPCVELDDPKGARSGFIALQLHSGGPIEVRFRNFRLDQNPAPRLKTLATLFEPKRVEQEGLSPAAAAKKMAVPPGFSVSLIAAEPDVLQPVAVAIDHRGRLWIAEAHSYPQRRKDGEGKDRILIFEDADADGRFETRKVFVDDLNLVSALEVGFGGVWVGSAPHLLFIPDRDGDDRPDGAPQVLLDGWGYQDTHETLNSFTWGPDGWLYGNQGVFTQSKVGKPGTPDDERLYVDAAVFRYHPTRHEFEVFAHGGSNQWGLDFDDEGHAFMTTCRSKNGGGPVTHVVQGAYYWRQAGSHRYPHVYDPMLASADHDHGIGGAGEPGSDQKYGGHAHVGTMIYLGGQWPDRYRNGLFTHNLHGNRINHELNERRGSGFVTKHATNDLLFMNDAWFIGVDLLYGPEGSMYMIDWYDRQRCHHHDIEKWDRTNGRIYRVDHGTPAREKTDVAKLTDQQLADAQLHRNEWHVRVARRVLQERAATRRIDAAAVKSLRALLDHAERGRRLRGLWALHAIGALDERTARGVLSRDDEMMRAWAVQLLNEKRATAPTVAKLTTLARTESSAIVRRYLASSLQRLPTAKRWPLIEALASHAADAEDRNVPHLIWFGTEPLVAQDLDRAMKLARATTLPLLARSVYRRAAQDPHGLDRVVAALGKADAQGQKTLLDALSAALEGGKVKMPAGWEPVARGLLASDTTDVRRSAETLSAQFGDPSVFPELRRRLGDRSVPVADRRHAFDTLLLADDAESVPIIQQLLDEAPFRAQAIRALARFDTASTPEALLSRYARWNVAERAEAITTLSNRPHWAVALLDAIGAGRVPPKDLSPFAARQMAKLDHPEIAPRLARVWGNFRAQSDEIKAQVAHFKRLYRGSPEWSYDASEGRAVYNKVCAPCHKMFGTGGEIGPDLTGSNRHDLDYLLENIVDPSALIGRDYQLSTIKMKDGQVISGMIHARTDAALTVKTVTETLTVARKDVAGVETADASMMPEGLLSAVTETEVKHLLKYLMAKQQVGLPGQD